MARAEDLIKRGLTFGTLLMAVYAMLQFAVYGLNAVAIVSNTIVYALIALPVAAFFTYTGGKLEYEEALAASIAAAIIIGVGTTVIGGIFNIAVILIELVRSMILGFVTGVSAYTLSQRIGV